MRDSVPCSTVDGEYPRCSVQIVQRRSSSTSGVGSFGRKKGLTFVQKSLVAMWNVVLCYFASLYSEHQLFAPSTTANSISPPHSRHFSASEPEVPTPNQRATAIEQIDASASIKLRPVTWTVDSYILIRQRLDDPYHVTTVKKSYQAHLHGAPTVQYDIVFPARFGAMQLSIVLAVLGRCDRSSGTEWQYICQGYWRSGAGTQSTNSIGSRTVSTSPPTCSTCVLSYLLACIPSTVLYCGRAVSKRVRKHMMG